MSRIPDFSAVDWASIPVSGARPDAAPWLTPEGIPVKTVYGPQDRAGIDFLDTYPGIAPYLRGPYPTMYVNQPWTVRQYAGFSTAEDSNAFYRRNLAAGQKGLSVAFDLATHRGYDSDHPRVSGDVGMAGVAINSIYDMRTLFSGIPLDRMSVSMTMNGAVLPILALYIVAAEEQGVPADKLSGTIQNDILKEFMVRNTYIYPPKGSMRIISDIFAYTSTHMPKFNSISISGYHMQEAGATQDLELAYTLADGVEYIRAGIAAGLTIDQFAPRLSFFWAVGMNFFMEVAKMRAARLIWAKLVKDVRSAKRKVSAVAHPFADLGLVARRAGRVQQRGAHLRRGDGSNARAHAIAAHQRARRGACAADRFLGAHRAQHTALPAAGKRHDPHHRSVGRLLLRREADAGTGRESVEPYPGDRKPRRHGEGDRSRAFRNCASRKQPPARRRASIPAIRRSSASIASRPTMKPPSRFCKVDNASVRNQQIEKLRRLRAERDQNDVDAALAALSKGAARQRQSARPRGESRACESDGRRDFRCAGKSLGPARARRSRRSRASTSGRWACRSRPWSRCIASWRISPINDGRRPRILVAKMGQDGHDRGQKVIASAFADLGFDVDIGPLFATPAEAARQAIENDVHIIGVSSLAAGHLSLVPELKARTREYGRDDIMIVVGGVIPQQDFDALREAGASADLPARNGDRRRGDRVDRRAEPAPGLWAEAGGGVIA